MIFPGTIHFGQSMEQKLWKANQALLQVLEGWTWRNSLLLNN
jgi:hypothetical protein